MAGLKHSLYFPNDPEPLGVMYAGEWRFYRDALADRFECDVDDIRCVDVYWGGAHDDDNSCDVIVVRGKIVASYDQVLSLADLKAIYTSLANEHAKLGLEAVR